MDINVNVLKRFGTLTRDNASKQQTIDQENESRNPFLYSTVFGSLNEVAFG